MLEPGWVPMTQRCWAPGSPKSSYHQKRFKQPAAQKLPPLSLLSGTAWPGRMDPHAVWPFPCCPDFPQATKPLAAFSIPPMSPALHPLPWLNFTLCASCWVSGIRTVYCGIQLSSLLSRAKKLSPRPGASLSPRISGRNQVEIAGSGVGEASPEHWGGDWHLSNPYHLPGSLHTLAHLIFIVSWQGSNLYIPMGKPSLRDCKGFVQGYSARGGRAGIWGQDHQLQSWLLRGLRQEECGGLSSWLKRRPTKWGISWWRPRAAHFIHGWTAGPEWQGASSGLDGMWHQLSQRGREQVPLVLPPAASAQEVLGHPLSTEFSFDPWCVCASINRDRREPAEDTGRL